MVALLNLISLLVILVVNLGVVLIFAATAAVCTLCAAFFKVTLLLGNETAMLSV